MPSSFVCGIFWRAGPHGLLDLSKQILELTKEVRAYAGARQSANDAR
jgi:hypothetical protein